MKIDDLTPYQRAMLLLTGELAGKNEAYIEDLLKETDPGGDTPRSSFHMAAGGYNISIIKYIDPALNSTIIKKVETEEAVTVQWFIENILQGLPPGQRRLLTEKLRAQK